MIYTQIKNYPNHNDLEISAACKQWFSTQAEVVTQAEAKIQNRVFYLLKALGTNLSLTINDAAGSPHTVFTNSRDLSFYHPLCLGENGFAFSGTIKGLIGFYV